MNATIEIIEMFKILIPPFSGRKEYNVLVFHLFSLRSPTNTNKSSIICHKLNTYLHVRHFREFNIYQNRMSQPSLNNNSANSLLNFVNYYQHWAFFQAFQCNASAPSYCSVATCCLIFLQLFSVSIRWKGTPLVIWHRFQKRWIHLHHQNVFKYSNKSIEWK